MMFALWIVFNFFHPVYVSFTEINHNTKTQTIQISSRIFFEDLGKAIEEENKVKFNIANFDDKKTKMLVAKYIKQHFEITVNGHPASTVYLGYEIQGDVALCYQEVKNVDKISKIKVFNNILYKLHDDQTNLVEFKVNGESKTIKFQPPITTIETSL